MGHTVIGDNTPVPNLNIKDMSQKSIGSEATSFVGVMEALQDCLGADSMQSVLRVVQKGSVLFIDCLSPGRTVTGSVTERTQETRGRRCLL